MLLVLQPREWEQARKTLAELGRKGKTALDNAITAEAKLLEKGMKGNLDKVGPPNAPATMALRKVFGGGGRGPLNATGQMRRSIMVTRTGNGTVFVGILRTAPRGGKIVDIQEKGANIRVTPKMRRFLHVMLRLGGAKPPPSTAGVVTIRIPPRPFISQITAFYAENGEPIKQRILGRMKAELGLT